MNLPKVIYLEAIKLVQMSDYKAERVIFEFGANIL